MKPPARPNSSVIKQAFEKSRSLSIGATASNGGVGFRVWAPKAKSVSAVVLGEKNRIVRLKKAPFGYFQGAAGGIGAGARYYYLLDGKLSLPDPASRYQPEGVHGPSEVVDPEAFKWSDGKWKGLPLSDYIFYELHVGTFTAGGTFKSSIRELQRLKALGATAVEIMPVAQFPGGRNWGYDGTYPFAPQNTYGGPEGLKSLVNACHEKGLAAVLDVVYNHLGPEGNYLGNFGPYFTDRYRTPWGDAINFDGPHSDEVRRYFIENALYWVTEFHFDALRVDAIHGIYDFSARCFLEELAEAVHRQAGALGRKIHVIAESDLNDVRAVRPAGAGGFGLDAQWNDDFHHALHTLLTGEDGGYYEDFGGIRQMEKAMREGFVYSGQYSKFRKRRHGSSSVEIPPDGLVVFSQNHDQVGNRMSGDRPAGSLEKLKLAASVVILSPYLPLIFMGEEYGETAPFQYFTSHTDAALAEAVRLGRRREFSSFGWQGQVPDPQDEKTFLRSKLNVRLRNSGKHKALYEYYGELIRLRKETPASGRRRENMDITCYEKQKAISVLSRSDGENALYVYNFGPKAAVIEIALSPGSWVKALDSSARRWAGEGGLAEKRLKLYNSKVRVRLNPYGFALYRMTAHRSSISQKE